jgi:tousled-like kinase
LNPSWSEGIKDNYIKHALRENEMHKDLDHPNIVRHYDTLELDSNSFATVLEFCEGPDLHFYLKKWKMLNEKEAKSIIK